MRKTLRTLIVLAAALTFFGASSFAQTTLTQTTLSVALGEPAQGSPAQTVVVAASTNVLAGNLLYIDNEEMLVTSPTTATTTAVVQRGYDGTQARSHAANTVVYVGTPAQFSIQNVPTGSCTRANLSVVPVVSAQTGLLLDCVNGRWVSTYLTTQRGEGPKPWRQVSQNSLASGLSSGFGTTALGNLLVAATGYAIVDSDYIVALSTTATGSGGTAVPVNTITLPLAANYPGRVLIIKDESGGIGATTLLLLNGTINGVPTTALKSAFAGITIYAGSGGWFSFGCSTAGFSC